MYIRKTSLTNEFTVDNKCKRTFKGTLPPIGFLESTFFCIDFCVETPHCTLFEPIIFIQFPFSLFNIKPYETPIVFFFVFLFSWFVKVYCVTQKNTEPNQFSVFII